MDDVFNPYAAWLGIDHADGLPDHYTLLGLPEFEKDSRRITSACDGMLARVRGHRPGPHLKEWSRLLDELNAAKSCLLDPYRREEYDQQLRGRDKSAPVSTVPAPSGSSPQPTYMWPPGFEPPGYKPNGAAPAESSSPTRPAAASHAEAKDDPSQSEPAKKPETPTAVPVLSPSSGAQPPQAQPLQSDGNTAMPTAVPTARPLANPSGNAVPTAMPIASPGPAPPTAQPYNPPTATPVASPVQASQPSASQPPGHAHPPGGMFGGADPMAPVSAQGAAPIAQPAGPYGQAPMAQPAYGGQQLQYGQPGAYPVQATPVSAVPTATPVSAQPVTAQPVRAVPVSAVHTNAAESDLGLNVPTKSTSKAYKQARKKSSVPMVIAAMMAASILVIVAFMIFLRDGTLLAEKENQPKSAREMPIPPPQPVKVVQEADTNSMLSSLGADDPTPPPKKTPRKSTIGPLMEEGQEPESMPLVDPVKKPTETPESVIPDVKKPDPKPMPEPQTPTSTATPAQTAEVRKTLGEALIAMGYRDWDTSDAMLEKAKKQATDGVLQEKVEAVKFLSDNVKEYWNGVKEATKQLEAAQTLQIGNSTVAVVESNATTLILRVNGNNRRYPVGDLPMGLARSLGDTWFDLNAPSTKVFTGSFLLVEPNGDKEEVRQLWNAARQGGVDMDLLMPLLDDDLRAAASEDDAT